MKTKNKAAIYATSLTTVILLSTLLTAAVIDGIMFNNSYNPQGVKLELRGLAILNYMFVIKAYAGALYMENGTPSSAVLGDIPRALELYYFHNISAEDFRVSTTEMIKRNTTDAEYSNIIGRLDKFNSLYRGVKPGDRYRAEYIPGKGTTLYLNGAALGKVPGNDFSRAFFSIWIGRDPIDKKFRDRLLGK